MLDSQNKHWDHSCERQTGSEPSLKWLMVIWNKTLCMYASGPPLVKYLFYNIMTSSDNFTKQRLSCGLSCITCYKQLAFTSMKWKEWRLLMCVHENMSHARVCTVAASWSVCILPLAWMQSVYVWSRRVGVAGLICKCQILQWIHPAEEQLADWLLYVCVSPEFIKQHCLGWQIKKTNILSDLVI